MPQVHPERLTVLLRAKAWSPERLEREIKFLVEGAYPELSKTVSANHIRRLGKGETQISLASTTASLARGLGIDHDVLVGKEPMPAEILVRAADARVDERLLRLARVGTGDRQALLESFSGERTPRPPFRWRWAAVERVLRRGRRPGGVESCPGHVGSRSASGFARRILGFAPSSGATRRAASALALEPSRCRVGVLAIAFALVVGALPLFGVDQDEDVPRQDSPPPNFETPGTSTSRPQSADQDPDTSSVATLVPGIESGLPWYSPTAATKAWAQLEQADAAWSKGLLISEWMQHRRAPTTLKAVVFRAFVTRLELPPVGSKAQQDAQKALAAYDEQAMGARTLNMSKKEYLDRKERTRLVAAILDHPQKLWQKWSEESAALDQWLVNTKGGRRVSTVAQVQSNQGAILVDLVEPQASFAELLTTARDHDAELCIDAPPFAGLFDDPFAVARTRDLAFVPCQPFVQVVHVSDS